MTKAEEVEIFLREKILAGQWKEGQILPGEMELLSTLGVSRATLRQALGILAAEGLIVRKKSSGTFVAPRARSTGIVAITAIDRDLSSRASYWSQRIADLSRARIEEAGFRPVLAVGCGGRSEDFLTSLTILDGQNRRDLIGVIDTAINLPLIERLHRERIPTVSIAIGAAKSEPAVVLDYGRMMELAVDAFKAHGIDDFAVMDIKQPPSNAPGWEDVRHIRDYSPLKSAIGGRDDRMVFVQGGPNFDHAYDAFIEWWKRPDRPNAIFFVDDVVCDVAIRAISDLRIEIPKDLAILTHANKGKDFHSPVALTRIEFDPAEVVDIAWRMLNRLIEGKPLEEPIRFVRPRLVMGESL